MMDWRAKAFVTVICVGSIALLAVELAGVHLWVASAGSCSILLAAVLASGLKVELPGINGWLAVNLIVNLVAVVELSPGEALAVGCTWASASRFGASTTSRRYTSCTTSHRSLSHIDLSYLVFHQ